jgi:hypothetical protein
MDDLLQRIALHRDPQAFQDLFRLYGPRIKAMMMRQGADAAAAEDIAQEVGSVLPPKALDPGNDVLMPAPLRVQRVCGARPFRGEKCLTG